MYYHYEEVQKDSAIVAIDAEWQEKNDNNYKQMTPEGKQFYDSFVRSYQVDESYPLLVQMGLDFQQSKRFLFFIDEQVYNLKKAEIEDWVILKKETEKLDVEVLSIENIGAPNLLDCALELWEVPKKTPIELLMFYSPKDLQFSLGEDYLKMLENRLLEQKKGIKIAGSKYHKLASGYRIRIRDLKGWQSQGGLKELCASVNVKMRAKTALDAEKSRMVDAFIHKPETAMEYSLGDVESLMDVYPKFQRDVEDLSVNLLGVKIDFELPMTTGSLVARIFEEWLKTYCGDKEKFEYCSRKLGILDVSSEKYKSDLTVFNLVTKSIKNWGQVNAGQGSIFERKPYRDKNGELKESKESLFERFLKIKPQYNAYSQASVGYYAYRASVSTEGLNAIVQGGRCFNEDPSNYKLSNGLDIDLKSCYGSALSNFQYPLGLPTTYGYTTTQVRPSLGEFLKENESEFVDGLWQIVVDTEELLNFRQDLVFSKTTTLKQIQSAYVEGFKDGDVDTDSNINEWWMKEDPANIPGEFGLARKEIRNGIITAKVLKTLRSVATRKELGELMLKVKVVSAVIYRRSDRAESPSLWMDTVIADKGVWEAPSGKVSEIKDSRTRAWLQIPISAYIDPLLEERSRIKKLKKTSDDPALSARDTLVKLLNNTLYGVIASPYFAIGNVVVANNITAKARVGAWMMNKALHTRMSITDGGFYTPLKVPYLDRAKYHFKKPGLNGLSNIRDWASGPVKVKTGQSFTTLGGEDWQQIFTKATEYVGLVKSLDPQAILSSAEYRQTHLDSIDWEKFTATYKGYSNPSKTLDYLISYLLISLAKMADDLAVKHIADFWSVYGLDLEFDIEHKETNTFTKAAYGSKGHYAFETIANKRVCKIRGAKQYKPETGLKESPYYQLFTNVLDDLDTFPEVLDYDHTYLLKMGEYYKARSSKEGSYEVVKGKMPGDSVVSERYQRFQNGHMFFDTVDDIMNVKKKKAYSTKNGVKVPIAGFERYGKLGTARVVREMVKDSVKRLLK